MARRQRNESADRAEGAREVRKDQHVDALEAELAGYESRLKVAEAGPETDRLKSRIADVKKEITAAKKGHGTGPKGRVTDPTGGSNPAPAAPAAEA
jgi:hypothetical protein